MRVLVRSCLDLTFGQKKEKKRCYCRMADFIFIKSFQCTMWKTLRNYTSRQEPQEPTLNSQKYLIALHINREFDLPQDEGPKSTVLESFWFFSPVTLQRSVPHPVSSFTIMGVWYDKAVYTVWFRMCNIGNTELRVQYSVRLYFRCLLLILSTLRSTKPSTLTARCNFKSSKHH